MFLVLSHAIGAIVLAISSYHDIFNDRNVPDLYLLIGLASGIVLNILHLSVRSGPLNTSTFLLTGFLISVASWLTVFLGKVGGADAMCMSMLSFTSLINPSTSQLQILDLFFNVLVGVMSVTLIYTGYLIVSKLSAQDLLRSYGSRKLITAISGASSLLFITITVKSGISIALAGFVTLMLVVLPIIKDVEDKVLRETVDVDDLEGGEVIDVDGLESIKQSNAIGKFLSELNAMTDSGLITKFLTKLDKVVGYTEVQGVTDDEIKNLRENGIDEVEVLGGVPLVPAFLIGLLLTDLTSSGLWILYGLY